MSKRIILMRHAEAENEHDQGDYYRNLTKAGQTQAENAAKLLTQYAIDRILVSPATRTQQTLRIILDQTPDINVEVIDEIYSRGYEQLLDIVRQQPNDISNLLIIGHNPAIYQLALELIEQDTDLINFPMKPASIVVISIADIDLWQNLKLHIGTLKQYI